MLLLLLLIVPIWANNYTLLNACIGNVDLTELKGHMATVFHDHIYNPNLNRPVAVQDGKTRLLNFTSSLQTDLIINAIDGITLQNGTHCKWKEIFEMYYTPSALHHGVHYIFFFYDSTWCGSEPWHCMGMFKMHHVVVPIAIGSHVDRMDMYHLMGPCPKPKCYNWKDYLMIN